MFLWVKIVVDLLGLYLILLLGNCYIVGFIDIYSGYLDVFLVKNKIVENVVYFIIEEIFLCYGCLLVFISDNGIENIVKEV